MLRFDLILQLFWDHIILLERSAKFHRKLTYPNPRSGALTIQDAYAYRSITIKRPRTILQIEMRQKHVHILMYFCPQTYLPCVSIWSG